MYNGQVTAPLHNKWRQPKNKLQTKGQEDCYHLTREKKYAETRFRSVALTQAIRLLQQISYQ